MSGSGGLLGRFHHRGRPPSAAGGGGDRLFFTVRDLIAHRFHYLCTNVTFSSDQGARQPPAARLASCQAVAQKGCSKPKEEPVVGGVGGGGSEERRVTGTRLLLTPQLPGRGCEAARLRGRTPSPVRRLIDFRCDFMCFDRLAIKITARCRYCELSSAAAGQRHMDFFKHLHYRGAL